MSNLYSSSPAQCAVPIGGSNRGINRSGSLATQDHHPALPGVVQRPGARCGTLREISPRVPLAVQDARQPAHQTVPAHELLTELRARSIPCAIVSNKGIAAVRDVLATNQLSSLIELVVGDGEPADCPRKPDPGLDRGGKASF